MKLFTFLFAASALQADVITRDFIDRVAIIESNFNHAAIGDNKKAYGAWQLHEAAFREGLDWHKNNDQEEVSENLYNIYLRDWKKYAQSPENGRLVATSYFKLLEYRFSKRGIKPTRLQLYMAYNMGFYGASVYDFNPHTCALPADRYAILRRAELILNK